jgi:hypothetical protein
MQARRDLCMVYASNESTVDFAMAANGFQTNKRSALPGGNLPNRRAPRRYDSVKIP